MRRARPLSLAAVCAVLCAAPRDAKMTCATCHSREARSQPGTDMGVGIELPETQGVLKANPRLTAEANGYTYLVERKNGASTYTVTDGSGSLTLPIRYAFGVRNQTFVLEYQGKFFESLMSYYESAGGLAVTMGDEGMRPHTLVEAMGRETSNDEITACFNCHGTGGVRQGKLTLESLEPGVNCGHCHGGAEAHLSAMRSGRAAPVPAKLGDLAAEDMSHFCGQCHRTWETVVGQHLFGPLNVRFQPYRLENSKCFLGKDKRIRCTACHNPHEDLVRDDSRYDAACLACHRQTEQKACPAGDKNCVSCHMPKVQMAGPKPVFTDHFVRVSHAGEPYPD